MRGKILEFDEVTGKGSVATPDGTRVDFAQDQWLGVAPPAVGAEVEFVEEGRLMPVRRHRRPFTWPWFLFSIQGRVTRREYWLKYQLPWIGSFLAVVVIGWLTADGSGHNAVAGAALAFLLIASAWPGFAVQVKRMHDRNFSAWYLLLGGVPFLGEYWVMAQVAFMPSKRGDNRFGPDPLA
ncbi:DUF805 domain-containing protein [Nitrospirillum iridis]|uniref:Uncharacterized membrane protein YhaH (DUF805 family) n=1 Tax=Nitrospirillum iridis TaxID=765888 RepID=A0A7X0AXS6_9PROT|nr:DUF805 domain-containing protein [Nitrospirillum iridis]MBB6251276.1 uncharacterized membrane protein YhaH (DUF805 family) [Nitrospirillum iridis]